MQVRVPAVAAFALQQPAPLAKLVAAAASGRCCESVVRVENVLWERPCQSPVKNYAQPAE